MSKRKPDRAKPATPPTDWGKVASWYDSLVGESGSEYHREVVLPGVLRLLKVEPTQRVLDVACGQGVLARQLALRGVEVTGVEAAAALVEAARTYDQQLPPEAPKPLYHVGDALRLEFLPPASFHAAACVLAIQNIQPIAPLLSGVAHGLVERGRFVVVMMHPCFRGAKESSWGWDDRTQYRRVDRYLLPRKHPIVTHPGADPGTYTWTFHRPIESYVKAFRAASLLIDAMEEWPSHKTSQPGPRAAAENTARREIPMFLAIRGVKLTGGE